MIKVNSGPSLNKDTARFILARVGARDWEEHPPPPGAALDDWAQWLLRNELGPLVYGQLKAQPQTAWRPMAERLAASYWTNGGANSIKFSLLAELQAGLQVVGIEPVLLKGMAYCLTIYPDTAVRPMNDLDFLIRREEATAVWRLMHEHGFQTEKLWASPAAVPDHIPIYEFFPKEREESDLSVEFHWDLVLETSYMGRLPLATWRERSWLISRPEQTARVLDPAAALLHACVHQMIHHRGELRFRWLCDIDRLVRGQGDYVLQADDWRLLLGEAKAAGVLTAVQTALKVTAYWFDTPLPPGAQTVLEEPVDPAELAHFRATAVPYINPARRVWHTVQGVPGVRRKLALLGSTLFPPPDYMMERYRIHARWLLPVYYLGRLLKGAWLALRGRMPRT